MSATVHLLSELPNLAQPPNFGGGEPPPGSGKLLTVGRWVLWCVSALCVIGLLFVGGKMATEFNHGEMSQHGKRLGAALAGIILVGASSGIAGALI
ncbi:conjugal transfer protein TrbC [Prauserella muralis]|uniref:Conjugal transfer protein TrbC n=1 Tax=Prauserella muralis TaxID=588067 RepID=A0A2V4ADE2_9PSEU|nr:conjugal transfer protein TrbC [Prauserella muralis]PXY16604.1 conjugal transfer protein TrbC [Prauserella muralis]TWE11148.1 hypothetical protein FHX69_7367 [Prauserella muralis]